MTKKVDEHWMGRALVEARRGIGLTSPNPPVGAVIVKEGREIACGWHQKSGQLHAERKALAGLKCGEATDATIYVTLEPCSTHGRTGACSQALIDAGISRVVYGARDPNPDHAGRADAILRAAGIKVTPGVLEAECHQVIRGFAMVQTAGRPWVIAKTAMSLDGRITRPPGEGSWLTGEDGREEVQILRSEVDAILTSGATVRADDPALTLRSKALSPGKEQPWRVVLSETERDWSQFRLFRDEHAARTLLYTGLLKYDVLRTLAKDHGVCQVLLEAGGRLLGSFHDEGLIDEWVIYLAPMVTGGSQVALGGEGAMVLEERLGLIDVSLHRVGRDLCARGVVDRSGARQLER